MFVDRTLGETLAISVATAQPLEMLLSTDIARQYNTLYINIKTLYRNFHGAYGNEDNLPTLSKMTELFVAEIITIRSIVSDSIPGKVKPVFYLTTCKSLPLLMPHAKLKQPTTPKQIRYEDLEKKVISRALGKFEEEEIHMFDVLVKGSNTVALMLTHYPLDLISAHTFRKLILLESHTGAIKSKTEWITKLNKNEAYINLPFNVLSLQVLGDKSLQFESLGRKLSESLVELANKKHWSANTGLEKIKQDIRGMKDKEAANTLIQLANVVLR